MLYNIGIPPAAKLLTALAASRKTRAFVRSSKDATVAAGGVLQGAR
jgi:hypothetical protein